MRHLSISLTVIFAAAALLLLGGCFETELTLGSKDAAKVDNAFCGDWNVTYKDGDQTKTMQMAIRNFDGKQYYVERRDPGSQEKPLRMSGWTADVKGVTFGHVTELKPDGTSSPSHFIVRAEL